MVPRNGLLKALKRIVNRSEHNIRNHFQAKNDEQMLGQRVKPLSQSSSLHFLDINVCVVTLAAASKG